MRQLTLQVDSGDRWLTSSSWGPPVETKRKEGLSLGMNITSMSPSPQPPGSLRSFPGHNELSNDITLSPEGDVPEH